MEDLFGKSLVTADGDKWYHQRKAAAKFFTAKALRLCLTTTMRKNMLEMYDVIDASVDNKAKPIDLLKLFHDFALQTFAEVGLGVDLKPIGGTEPHPMDTAIEESTPNLMRRMRLPAFIWKLERWVNVGPEREIAESLASCREWLRSVVDESLAAATARQYEPPKADADDVKSIVELFLAQSAEDKDGLRDEDLVDFIWTFVLASRGTSALALVCTFLIIAKHPHVETRLRDELASVFRDSDADTPYLTTENVSKLMYLEATIKEVLRLYPTIPIVQRSALADVEIAPGVKIAKGEMVAGYPYAMARLPSLWGADAAEFMPERWINDKTGNLIHRYHFTFATPNDCSHDVSIELMPTTPVMMHASRMSSKAAAA